ncbi:MAG: hypothetical protein ACK6CU_28650 [Deltaproteobacteria bacterium]
MSARLDPRLRLVLGLLVPGFAGHALQLTAEDVPWDPSAWERYWWTPGWHVHLWPEAVVALAVALAVAVLAMGAAAARDAPHPRLRDVRSPRLWLLVVAALYAVHYLTYPYRIRNHMSHMLASLGVVLLVWSILLWRRRSLEPRRADRLALEGLATLTCVTYFFAGLHKLNLAFTDLRVDDEGRSLSHSAAVEGLTVFWIYGDLGSEPPTLARWVAAWGTIAIEMAVPLVAWRVRRLRVPAVATLCLFHVPHVACMDVADYPMIASSFYPALFSRAEARIYAPFNRPRAWNQAGAALGVATQLWFMPWWGRLTVFGIVVLALWGYGLASVGHAIAARGAARRMRPRGRNDPARGQGATSVLS